MSFHAFLPFLLKYASYTHNAVLTDFAWFFRGIVKAMTHKNRKVVKWEGRKNV